MQAPGLHNESDPAIRRRTVAGNGYTLVVGLGWTGLSCVRFLARHGRPYAVTDSRTDPPGLASLEQRPPAGLFLGGLEPRAFDGADEIVVSPGVSLREPVIAAAAARGIPLVGDVELFAREVQAPVVAITGSNGKSTVTSLVGAMARRAGYDVGVGGNLGTPALELLEQVASLYVLELSSFQLETTASLNAATAVVLNVSPDHLDRYDDLTDYARAKARVYRGDGVPVINRDDARVAAMVGQARQVVRFGLGPPEIEGDWGVRHMDGEPWLTCGDRGVMPRAQLPLTGQHNTANALAAFALGATAGLPEADMVASASVFRGLPHRMALVAEHDGIRYLDDSKGTNVGATVAAVGGVEGPLVLIAGGDAKGADFEPLRHALAGKARAVVVIGRDGPRLGETVAGSVPVVEAAASMPEAVERARMLARPGDTVLLSPACASLDMYPDYAARGEAFAAAVVGLAR